MEHATKKPTPPWLIIAAGAVLIALVVVGVYFVSRPAPKSYAALTLPEGIEQPVWMPTAGPSLKELYAFAAQHREELQYIPCYCGCAPGHKNNFECYWKTDGTSTIVAYEEHAYG